MLQRVKTHPLDLQPYRDSRDEKRFGTWPLPLPATTERAYGPHRRGGARWSIVEVNPTRHPG